jgi:hypothetical protein
MTHALSLHREEPAMPAPPAPDGKPELHLVNPRALTFEKLVDLFRHLTRREPTEEGLADLRERWARVEARLKAAGGVSPSPEQPQ